MISQITPEDPHLESLDTSTEASVWPALTKTPPFFEIRGKTWPGDTISFCVTFFLIAVLIVNALSWAEIPDEIPLFASIETVKAVCVLVLLIGDINDKFNLLTCGWVSERHIRPLPYFAMKLIDWAVTFVAGITRSPSFSLFSSSTKTNILPRLASFKISLIFENFLFLILKTFNVFSKNIKLNIDHVFFF